MKLIKKEFVGIDPLEYKIPETHWTVMHYVKNADEKNHQDIVGFDAENAAEVFAEKNYVALNYPKEINVWVKRSGATKSTDWQRYSVETRVTPLFYAHRIIEATEND